MTQNNDIIRANFEKWAADESYILSVAGNGYYIYSETQNAWLGWVAAWQARQGDEAKLKLAEEALDKIASCPKTGEWYDGRDGYQRDEYEMYAEDMAEVASSALAQLKQKEVV